MIKVLITGANGFIGDALYHELIANGYDVIGVVRKSIESNFYSIGDITSETRWIELLRECKIVIHLAGRAHVMSEKSLNSLSEYRKINVDATINLAKQSIEMGVERFIYLSSIKVNGESSASTPFTCNDIPNPSDPYAISKFEAENELKKLSKSSGLELVIIRPPLVYGPGVKGNFQKIIKLVESGVPLPLGAISNKRSYISLHNLVNFIELCVSHPMAKNNTFLVSDLYDISTTQLLNKLYLIMHKPNRLFRVNHKILKLLMKFFHRDDLHNRILGNLQINPTDTIRMLGWHPPIDVDEGFRRIKK